MKKPRSIRVLQVLLALAALPLLAVLDANFVEMSETRTSDEEPDVRDVGTSLEQEDECERPRIMSGQATSRYEGPWWVYAVEASEPLNLLFVMVATMHYDVFSIRGGTMEGAGGGPRIDSTYEWFARNGEFDRAAWEESGEDDLTPLLALRFRESDQAGEFTLEINGEAVAFEYGAVLYCDGAGEVRVLPVTLDLLHPTQDEGEWLPGSLFHHVESDDSDAQFMAEAVGALMVSLCLPALGEER